MKEINIMNINKYKKIYIFIGGGKTAAEKLDEIVKIRFRNFF